MAEGTLNFLGAITGRGRRGEIGTKTFRSVFLSGLRVLRCDKTDKRAFGVTG